MENIENLKVLQSMAKDFTILFVEDSKALQKQVVLHLSHNLECYNLLIEVQQ